MTAAELLAWLREEARRQGQGFCIAAWLASDTLGIPERAAASLLRRLEREGRLECIHIGRPAVEDRRVATASCWRPGVAFWEGP